MKFCGSKASSVFLIDFWLCFLHNYFTLQYIILYYLNRYVNHWTGTKMRGSVRPFQQALKNISDFEPIWSVKHASDTSEKICFSRKGIRIINKRSKSIFK